MTDFKGTKTKWNKSERSIGFVYALNEKKERNIFSLNINNDGRVSDEEISANALLISKAPELLEILQLILEEKGLNQIVHSNLIYNAKQLIEEATNI